jgi:hypothetical protein
MAKIKALLSDPRVKWVLTALATAALASQNPIAAQLGAAVLGAYHVNTPAKADK